MAQTVICSICRKELKDVIELIRKSPGRIVVSLFREILDCNWTQCKSCKTLICKECSAGSPGICCERDGENHHDAMIKNGESVAVTQEPIGSAA
jgi:hypothetical protein